ncbi:MAG TPA: pantoate--beta-alanine ligase [Gammaproteobacteria bacterium]|jgi:pantoate--beta-alanine ligase|nr:pantoate--beta-alanine ligase [Gammaproteobacteria bacterium]HIL62477.1 pantoate--beta-alanine ligase [Porticoccaceae bacterium]HIN90101.1 pantoate--beta-alanine ligase [Porticoccaceae bacterium]|tara:strand:- start:32799 stop:33653 length:855 start_codon:yes stop_codon:yes gene_type:complete
MHTITHQHELREVLHDACTSGTSIGLVPTMGNLHAGHMELVKTAKASTDCVVSTIFVNPLQFGANEDLNAYPRALEADKNKLIALDCDFLFAPSVEDLLGAYPQQQSRIHVPGLSEGFCGSSRPGHFDGVATVVNKLINIVQPDKAFFGLKDYQQFLVIRKMVSDLALDVKIIGVETLRAESGLALSSRNNYLGAEQQQTAALIYRCLIDTAASIKAGDRDYNNLETSARDRLAGAGIKPDYFSICNAINLQAAAESESQFVILAAAYIGPSRLIDNIRFELGD